MRFWNTCLIWVQYLSPSDFWHKPEKGCCLCRWGRLHHRNRFLGSSQLIVQCAYSHGIFNSTGTSNFFPHLIYTVILIHHQLLLWQIESDSLLMLLPLCRDITGLAVLLKYLRNYFTESWNMLSCWDPQRSLSLNSWLCTRPSPRATLCAWEYCLNNFSSVFNNNITVCFS